MAEIKQEKNIKGAGWLLSICTLLNEWAVFIRGALRPQVIIPLAISIVALFFANTKDVDKNLSLLLQVIATVIGGIAISFFYDIIRNVFESNLLVKKGLSAVRNLSLARLKIKNISYREKDDASSEETINLLSLLEKDIANAVQEWNDILPGVGAIEEVYNLLAEKEADLQLAKNEKAQLESYQKTQEASGGKEKEELKERLAKKEEKIKELESQIIKLRTKTDSVPFYGSGFECSGVAYSTTPSFSSLPSKICSKCGKTYYLSPWVPDLGYCEDCRLSGW